MPAVKTVVPLAAQLVQFETSVPASEVVKRLEERVNRSGSQDLIPLLARATSKEELENGIAQISQGRDFMYFLSFRYDRWIGLLGDNVPLAMVYTIGNPLIAETIVKHDLRATYNIPLRLFVLEKEDRTGTYVLYHLPSSVMAPSGSIQSLTDAARGLDEKLESLVLDIVAESE